MYLCSDKAKAGADYAAGSDWLVLHAACPVLSYRKRRQAVPRSVFVSYRIR